MSKKGESAHGGDTERPEKFGSIHAGFRALQAGTSDRSHQMGSVLR